MRIQGMRSVRGAISQWVAAAALASGLAMAGPAQADTWQDALRDAHDLHEATEDLHERATRLDDHQVLPLTDALDHAAADLYHELKHHPSAAQVVPALRQTEAILNEASSAIALSHDMHHDRKAMALLKDARRHFVDTAEHVECLLPGHFNHAAPSPRRYQPQAGWPASPFGSQYSAPPTWYVQPSPQAAWRSGYR